jgi:hypothetical protein
MSLEIVRAVDRDFPALLQQNVDRTCYAFVVEVIRRLRAAGRQAYHVAKSPGEGQFSPPGFQARDVVGLDGKTYRCSGVSHDAIWCDGVIVDTIGRGNDSPNPIGLTGEPVWNEIPREHWRVNNPPLKDGGPPPPVPAPSPTIPSYEALGGDAFFRSAVGKPLADDAKLANDPLNDGSAVWFSRPIYRIIAAYAHGEQPNTAGIVNSVRAEWRALMPPPPNGWPPL